jgi:hypothetical protein
MPWNVDFHSATRGQHYRESLDRLDRAGDEDGEDKRERIQ